MERVPLSGQLRAVGVLGHLLRVHSSCLTFAFGLGGSTFLGATPEQLVRRVGHDVVASAVAGTAARGESPRKLQDSPKERAEHRMVVEALEAALREVCAELTVPERPSLLETGTVQHLRTVLRGRLSRRSHVLDLVARLHPTPAVCGTPRDRALELISKHEKFDRGWYAGLQGWFDPRGQGEFFVALRSGLIGPTEVSLFAGSGLVRDSDPDREAAETSLKLSSLQEALEANCAT
jgi:isochorismate synthase